MWVIVQRQLLMQVAEGYRGTFVAVRVSVTSSAFAGSFGAYRSSSHRVVELIAMELDHWYLQAGLARSKLRLLGKGAVGDIASSTISVSKQVLSEEIAEFPGYRSVGIVDNYYFLEGSRGHRDRGGVSFG